MTLRNRAIGVALLIAVSLTVLAIVLAATQGQSGLTTEGLSTQAAVDSAIVDEDDSTQGDVMTADEVGPMMDGAPATDVEIAEAADPLSLQVQPVETEVLGIAEIAAPAAVTIVPSASLASGLQAAGGDADTRFALTDPSVVRIPDLVQGRIEPDAGLPSQAPAGTISGWDIKDVRFRYVAATDTLEVALNSYGVIGDPEGNGDPSAWSPAWDALGLTGTDSADLGAFESAAVIFDLDQDGTPDIIAGVHSQNDISDFAIAELEPGGQFAPFLANFWGAEVDRLGAAPSTPTAANPDLIFSIREFSTIQPGDTSLDFNVNAQMGSSVDGNIGEDALINAAIAIPVSFEGEIGDEVWFDNNGDGIKNGADAGVPGVSVELVNEDGDVVSSTVTNGGGNYLFPVPPGTYSIRVIAPADRAFTQTSVGNPALDSNVDSSGRSGTTTLDPGDNDLTIDAGLVEFVPRPAIDIETKTNGVDSDVIPGETLTVGSTAEITYVVENIGNTILTGVEVTDPFVDAIICPLDELTPGASMTCEASLIVEEGQVIQLGTVTATGIEPDGDVISPVVTAEDPTHHVGLVPKPGVTIEKSTNGEDADEAPGPMLIIGDEVEFVYVVANTGNVDLTNVRVADDVLGSVCVVDLLAVDESTSCRATSTVVSGPYMNTGTVVGLPVAPDGIVLDEIKASDPSHHFAGPVCETEISGLRMHQWGTTVDETGYVAAPRSSIRIVTFEPGLSPKQPNEQVFVQVGDELFGPTPEGLGELVFETELGGPVVILHYSEVVDTNRADSVEYTWCGTDVSRPAVNLCPDTVTGPRMWKTHITEWVTGVEALPGAEIFMTSFEDGGSPEQPHEQVYVKIGDEMHGPTPAGLGDLTITTTAGGPITVLHWSELHPETRGSNSVQVRFCGTGLVELQER